jgi:hypothetical protein
MRVVDVIDADFMHAVEDVAQIRLVVHPHTLRCGHDPADDALLRRGRRFGAVAARVDVQRTQVRQQFAVDEIQQRAVARGEERLPFPILFLAVRCLWMMGFVGPRRGPILPTVGAVQRGCEVTAQRFGLLRLAPLLRIQNPQE